MTDIKDISLLDKIKMLLGLKKRIINSGDIGVYQELLTVNTQNEATHSLYYDIYFKVRAKAVYDDLVEIEIVDTVILNSCSDEIKTLIDTNTPRYIHQKFIKWENKSN